MVEPGHQTTAPASLATILDRQQDFEDTTTDNDGLEDQNGDSEDKEDAAVLEGFCIECEGEMYPFLLDHTRSKCDSSVDQPAEVHCSICSDNFCEVCFAAQHRKGSRKRHATTPLGGESDKKAKRAQDAAHQGAQTRAEDQEVRSCLVMNQFRVFTAY